MALFIDDTSLFHSRKRYRLTNPSDLNSISNWFARNKLTINTSKCETISFGSGKLPKLVIANFNIPDKPHCKYQGVYLDPKLNFREHISYVAKKLNNFCQLMYKMRYLYPMTCLLSFYNYVPKLSSNMAC